MASLAILSGVSIPMVKSVSIGLEFPPKKAYKGLPAALAAISYKAKSKALLAV